MIRARLIRSNGALSLTTGGHASAEVCATASLLVHSAAIGLRDLARLFPGEIVFDGYDDTTDWDCDLSPAVPKPKKKRRPRR